MITLKRIKKISSDIINDDEWVNDSHNRCEHQGIKDGLTRLINHLKETEKPIKNYTRKEIQEISKNMIAYGGSFFSNLGKCLQSADLENEKIILSQWSKEIEKYSKY